MPLSLGMRLGPYEILSPIGAGGMGEVYKARDTRLDRTVAVKVIPEAAAALPEVRQRFEREARAVSSLNHPNICSLFDIGRQDGIDYLVMEYLEGETLAERLKKGPPALEQALQFAIEIAGALEAAHRHGVIHRDLKPANIVLTASGPKVLDFGLAKIQQERAAVVSGGSVLQTLTSPLTGAGTIVGTLQYMAPEQLEGKEADARTDLFAFGAVLYEMVTGRRAFEAASHAALISSIMLAEPAPISTVQPLVSPALDHVVRTCLKKDPADRWQTVHDLVVQLKWVASTGSQAGVPAPVATRRRSRQRLQWTAVAALTLALLALSAVHFREKPPEARVARFQIPIPPKAAWTQFDVPALSPDGTKLVFAATVGKAVLWVRSLDTLAVQPLPGTEGANRAFWSPDSRSVGFSADGKLKKVDLIGAPPQAICETPGGTQGGTWNRDGTILFGKFGGPLQQVAAGGGEPKPALSLDSSRQETGQVWPWFLPDGRHFLFFSRSSDSAKSGIRVGTLGSAETRPLLVASSNASFVPPGFLVFGRQETLMAQSFDTGSLKLEGEAFPIAENVGREGVISQSVYSVSRNGVLVWRSAASTNIQIAAYSREGRRLQALGEPRVIRQMTLSPDERRLALEITDPKSGNRDLWLLDLARSIFSRVTYDPASDGDAVWSPDGRELVLTSTRKGHSDLYRKVVGGAAEEILLESAPAKYAAQWLPDGALVYLNATGKSFFRLPLKGEKKPETLFQSEFDKDGPTVSPDGHWVAYNSNESGRWEVYLATFPGFTERRQISNSGGCQAQWRKDGKELFYITLEGQIMAVDIKPGAVAEAALPRELFRLPVRVDPILNQYAVTGDGKKFLVMENTDDAPPPLTVVLNWNARLKR